MPPRFVTCKNDNEANVLKPSVTRDAQKSTRSKHIVRNSSICLLATLFVLIIFIAISVHPIFANETVIDEVKIVYFYYDYCSACKVSEKTLSSLNEYMKSNNKTVHLNVVFEDASIDSVYGLLTKYCDEYNVPVDKRKVPIAFVGDKFFTGAVEIKNGLLNQVNRIDLPETKIIDAFEVDDDSIVKQFSAIQVLGVFMAGMINGINPCSLSMYLLVLSLLLMKRAHSRKLGYVFIVSKFITYLLLGSFLYKILLNLRITWFGIASKIIIIGFVLAIVGMNIRDFYYAKKELYSEIKMQLPVTVRKMNHQWIRRAFASDKKHVLILMSVLLGFVISFGEFLCTGQMYLSTIIYMLNSNRDMSIVAYLYLFVYDFAMILPLIFITVIIDKSRGMFEITEKIREKLPLIKLVNAALFLIFGLFVVFWS